GNLVEVAEVALHLRHQGVTAEVGGVDVDGPGLLGHRVHRLLLAPHREADQLPALAVDDGPDAVLEPVHALVAEVGLDPEHGLVLAQVLRSLLCHVFLPLGLCPGSYVPERGCGQWPVAGSPTGDGNTARPSPSRWTPKNERG